MTGEVLLLHEVEHRRGKCIVESVARGDCLLVELHQDDHVGEDGNKRLQ